MMARSDLYPYNQAKYAALKPTEIPRKWMSRDLLIGEARSAK